ncbi:MAG: glutamate--tRNA ligase [Dehalococcoidia bacterium]|nr:MAG: glutamate--tRNA ligase [Dehalococcoidia bacterium]
MTAPVRVRYAPSPTGLPHVGNIRTAFFNWLFARHMGGSFIVRIEDTDVARTVPGALEGILEGLRWLGIDWDEGPEVSGKFGPYFQSQRLETYQRLAEGLVEHGYAYYCHCSSERLEKMRAEQTARKQPPGYDRCCRDMGLEAAQGAVIRFKTPLEARTTFHDLIRSEVTFENATLDDFVLLKSDGYPTYHLANVIDDHMMEISHVLRAEEWLSSTPRHLMLYNAFGFTPPLFAHLPIILGSDRSKLSKRHGAVSILEYKEQGYLPEAMANFLALLGWALDDKTELFSKDELIKNFSIERISQTSAIFNKEKLDWMDGVYMRKLSAEEFACRALPFLERELPPEVKRPLDFDYVKRVLPLVQERAKTLGEVAAKELTWFFFVDEIDYPAELLIDKKLDKKATLGMLEVARVKLDELAAFDAGTLESILRPLADEIGVKAGQLFGALRTAVTGLTATPPLFQTMEVLGQKVCLKRIEKAIDKLKILNSNI